MMRIGLVAVFFAVLCICTPIPAGFCLDIWTRFQGVILIGGTLLCLHSAVRFIALSLHRLFFGVEGELEDHAKTQTGFRRTFGKLLWVGFWCLYLAFAFHWVTFLTNKIRVGHMIDASSEIRSADLSCAKVLQDANARSFLDLFNEADALRQHFGTYANAWSFAIPELLRSGCNAKLDLKPDIRKKLGPGYMQIGNDPWGRPYHFFAGPLDAKVYDGLALATRFRSYRRPTRMFYIDRNGYQQTSFYYDAQARQGEVARLGTDTRVPESDGLPGFPAPADLPVYIWSMGADGKSCQRIGMDLSPENVKAGPTADSGDDINNWDSQRGWQRFYGGEY